MPHGHFEVLLGPLVLKSMNSKMCSHLLFLLLLGLAQETAGRSISKKLEETKPGKYQRRTRRPWWLPPPQRSVRPIHFLAG